VNHLTSYDVQALFVTLPTRGKLLVLAVVVLLVELALRRFAPESRSYARWTAFFLTIGQVWTAVLLSMVYAVAVGMVGLGMRMRGTDLLDRGLLGEPTFWRPHEPNPLGATASVRHQF
jgi:hypothetical protein